MRRVVDTWQRFWFEPEPTSTLALVRIAFGLVTVAWTLALAPSLSSLLGPRGVVPHEPGAPGSWSVLALAPQHGAIVALFAVLLVAAVCLTLGYRTRLAAVVVLVGLTSFERRNPFAFDSGDSLLRIIALYLALAPAGTSLSLDRLRRSRERFWEFPSRARWPLRLMQVQLSAIYLASVWAKTRGTTWNDGTAVSYALRIGDLKRFPVPAVISDSVVVTGLTTYGTLAVELAVAVLVWNRRARPWVLGAGVALHLGIEYSLRVGFFTLAMLVLYVAFVPPEAAARSVVAARDRLRSFGTRRARVAAPVAD